jgi:hypothetical protein
MLQEKLVQAVKQVDMRQINVLLRRGADANPCLVIACGGHRQGWHHVVELFLQQTNLRINECDEKGRCAIEQLFSRPLKWIAKSIRNSSICHRYKAVTQALSAILKHPHISSSSCSKVLTIAVENVVNYGNACVKAVQLLLDHPGIEIDTVMHGQTPLQQALRGRFSSGYSGGTTMAWNLIVILLIAHGASTHLLNFENNGIKSDFYGALHPSGILSTARNHPKLQEFVQHGIRVRKEVLGWLEQRKKHISINLNLPLHPDLSQLVAAYESPMTSFAVSRIMDGQDWNVELVLIYRGLGLWEIKA